MDSERVENIIIGAGITGAVITYLTNGTILEKAKLEGGRCSSGRLPNSLKFDKGATMLKRDVPFSIQNKHGIFNLQTYLEKIKNNFILNKIVNNDNMFLPQNRMQSLVGIFLENSKKFLSTKISRIQKDNNFWKVIVDNGTYFYSKNLVITTPLPQAMELIKETTVYKDWYSFTQPYSDYKQCLVLAGLWENRGSEISLERSISELNHNIDMEYFTIESHKISDSKDLVISIQFGDKFSEKNFEAWENEKKDPSQFAHQMGNLYFNEIFSKYNLKYDPPNFLKSHKWKYTFPKQSLFNKDESIDFDNPKFKDFLRLCNRENLWITGDWVFGQRVTKCILGALFIGSILRKEPFQSVEDFLT
jgi:predicted NAD/FAD-dependent oxidoreductase